MPRQHRLDFKDAIQFVHIRGRDGSNLFFEASVLKSSEQPRRNAPNLRRFEQMLTEACEEYGTVMYGYCLEPNVGTLVLQTSGGSLESFMAWLCGRYARFLHDQRLLTKARSPFTRRYDSKVIAPEYLLHAVRRVHGSPVGEGLCRQRVDYPFSSERAYMGEPVYVPLDMGTIWAALEQKGYFGFAGYRRFMDQNDSLYIAHLFAHGSRLDPRIVGANVFVSLARDAAAHPPPSPTSDQLIAEVARLMKRSPKAIYSATHEGVLGRSLVAWFALRTGAATLTEAGHWFSVSGSTLARGIRRYRRVAPDLFERH